MLQKALQDTKGLEIIFRKLSFISLGSMRQASAAWRLQHKWECDDVQGFLTQVMTSLDPISVSECSCHLSGISQRHMVPNLSISYDVLCSYTRFKMGSKLDSKLEQNPLRIRSSSYSKWVNSCKQ